MLHRACERASNAPSRGYPSPCKRGSNARTLKRSKQDAGAPQVLHLTREPASNAGSRSDPLRAREGVDLTAREGITSGVRNSRANKCRRRSAHRNMRFTAVVSNTKAARRQLSTIPAVPTRRAPNRRAFEPACRVPLPTRGADIHIPCARIVSPGQTIRVRVRTHQTDAPRRSLRVQSRTLAQASHAGYASGSRRTRGRIGRPKKRARASTGFSMPARLRSCSAVEALGPRSHARRADPCIRLGRFVRGYDEETQIGCGLA